MYTPYGHISNGKWLSIVQVGTTLLCKNKKPSNAAEVEGKIYWSKKGLLQHVGSSKIIVYF